MYVSKVFIRSIQFCILICYFVSLVEESEFPKGHREKLGSHQVPEGNVEELWVMPNASVFYDSYVLKSKPVIFKGAGKESNAFKLWTDSYLRWVISNTEMVNDYVTKLCFVLICGKS